MSDKYCIFNNKIYLIYKITNNEVTLKIDNKVVHTSLNNIDILPDDFIPNKKNSRVNISLNSLNMQNEIMLRHMTKEEAIYTLDKFIDNAITRKLGRIKIIHGRHGGILRKAVHEYLKSHPFVKEYHLATFGEGDIGVTVAILGRTST